MNKQIDNKLMEFFANDSRKSEEINSVSTNKEKSEEYNVEEQINYYKDRISKIENERRLIKDELKRYYQENQILININKAQRTLILKSINILKKLIN